MLLEDASTSRILQSGQTAETMSRSREIAFAHPLLPVGCFVRALVDLVEGHAIRGDARAAQRWDRAVGPARCWGPLSRSCSLGRTSGPTLHWGRRRRRQSPPLVRNYPQSCCLLPCQGHKRSAGPRGSRPRSEVPASARLPQCRPQSRPRRCRRRVRSPLQGALGRQYCVGDVSSIALQDTAPAVGAPQAELS